MAASIIEWGPDDTIVTHAAEIMEAVDHYSKKTDVGLVRIEDVVAPTGHLGIIGIEPLLKLARMIGYLEAMRPDWELVRPAGHGSRPLEYYPKSLVGPKEKKGKGRWRHVRSAYDVATSVTV